MCVNPTVPVDISISTFSRIIACIVSFGKFRILPCILSASRNISWDTSRNATEILSEIIEIW